MCVYVFVCGERVCGVCACVCTYTCLYVWCVCMYSVHVSVCARVCVVCVCVCMYVRMCVHACEGAV